MSIDRPTLLKNLPLYGMAAAWSEWQAEYARQQKPVMPEVWLDRLIEAEQVDRQARRLNDQLKAARFPLHRDLMQFEAQETPLQRARIEQPATAGFMDQAYNLIPVGGTGTGKTHLATALAVAAIHQGKRVRFYNAVDLVNQLDKEKQQGKAGNLAKQLIHMDAVILDELGCLPFPESGGVLLLSHQPFIRKDIPNRYHQSQLCRMGASFWRRQDDHGTVRSHYSSRRHSGNRQRFLSI